MVVSTFTLLYNHHQQLSLKPFSSSPAKTTSTKPYLPPAPPLQATVTTLLSASMKLTSLGTSHRWNWATFVFLRVASFT